ncbi:ubiquinone/menaquinone biosynthesis C-methylase UbiE [Mumia flava]|uniref:Ubiquinone/menaquinone biosynthesis C-methylase UbiE n=1 Tax=Mumia flava TaxID=1348852 RepID=A0A0B2B9R5_9ACTN|nr:class I SAM-dependent methyltransferase [Mumia flava]PJJ48267.1 ubiquinone/menaquinone biosynthesis C-methylase UbiE [Mumia flava]
MGDNQGVGTPEDQALKGKHRAMWGMGDYPAVERTVIPGLGATLVEALGVRAGERVLDVAAGAGNAAIPAALRGADVVASDLSPALLDAGRAAADERGATLEWQEADAEALPYDDDGFDVVMSCVGVMFAPHHGPAADELVRVCAPGGRIGLISWTPQGFIGQMFATMKPFAPPPPPGAQPPPLWGSEDHVRELFGDRVADLRLERRTVRVEAFAAPEDFRDLFKEAYGPTIVAYGFNAEDPERVAALDAELADLARRYDHGGDDGVVMEWEYLLVTGTVR